MKIQFWGVRGSIPSPVSPSEIRDKISAIIEQILPQDIASPGAREKFLSALPPWLYGTVGGNTPCVSVSAEGLDGPVIFDCGSGLRDLGICYNSKKPSPKKYHIVFSHFHWDHLQGLPFFDPAYNSSISIDFYSPKQGLKEFLSCQMQSPYFPVTLESMACKKNYILIDSPFSIGQVSVDFKKMNHPGDSYSYKLTHNGKKVIYATDTELTENDLIKNNENVNFFQNADIIILDAQYTMAEAQEKNNWGHNAFNKTVDFAAAFGIKRLILFHHDPAYSDQKIYSILQSAQLYKQEMKIKDLEIGLAYEGLEITI